MRTVFSLLLTFCMLLAPSPLGAQHLTLRNFDRHAYHAGTQNWSIAQGADGRMLFGNALGLLTFDGGQWNVYPNGNYSDVRAVFFDQEENRILVGGTKELGYFQGSSRENKLVYHSLKHLLSNQDLNEVEVWNICRWRGYAVFQNKTSILLWDFKDKMKVVRVPHRIESMATDERGILIVCNEKAYSYQGQQLVELKGLEPLYGKNVRSALPYHGNYLLATEEDGLFLYLPREQRTVAFELDISSFLKKNQIFCAAILDETLAIGTIRNGLVLRNLQTGRTDYVNSAHGLEENTVLAIGFDRQHNIWMGLNNGIAYALTSGSYYKLLNNHIGSGCASALMDDRLYLGTSQGLFVAGYPLKNGPTQEEVRLVDGMNGQVWCLTPADGYLICGTDHGAFVIDKGKSQRIKGALGTLQVVPLRHHPGYLLGCDYEGFFILSQTGARVTLTHRLKGFPEISGKILEDSDGSIWVSHWQKGIYHFRLSSDLLKAEQVEYFHEGNGLLVDNLNTICRIKNRVYVSSVDGLHQYDAKRRQLELNKDISSIFNKYGSPLTIYETPEGDLWAYTVGFMALAQRKGKGYVVDNVSYNGMIDNLQMSMGDPSFLERQTIFNGLDGFYVAFHDEHPMKYESKVYVRRIYSTNEGDSLVYMYFPQKEQQPLRVAHGQNSLRIEFIMPEYRDPQAVAYSYWLEGYDKAWSSPQVVNNKEYKHLPKGIYTFHVKALNRLTGQEDEFQQRIEILPAWYETWWAYLIYIILLGLTVYALAKYQKARYNDKLRRVKKEQERQLREQEREFQIQQAQQEKELALLRNEQLNIQLKHKASQLADSTINLVRKNEMLQEIDQSMFELSEGVKHDEAKPAIQKRIKDIRRGIDMNMSDDSNWQKFEENFNLVYDNFMQKLTEQFPDLKMNDRKLCAYLRMNLSSKEIASLMNCSERSIETARYRLRKKLALDQGDNLVAFLQKY
ncbi:triple tyrosine motif-containing protein [Xylanibacter brevis]|uniref:triple tyrosine motif-containing protein n=1 Tax=Xylanibacter brevis TaxID=83231 RepID=UPI0009DCF5C1|nr:triple tyrosine motif-containing protein [Xylanibacter brevis]